MALESRIEAEIMWSEIVKPSSPTPLNRKTFTLSYIDQHFPAPFPIPLVLIYAKNIHNNTALATPWNDNNICAKLKDSLSETLTVFYPWAGRCDDDNSTILCDDQGVPFTETRVNCSINDLLNSSHKLDLLDKFLPALDYRALMIPRPASELVPLSFQVNVFECGGIVIGCYFLHKLMDIASISFFLRYWGVVTSKRNDDDRVEPNFGATVTAFPPQALPAKVGGDGGSAGDDNAGSADAGAGVDLEKYMSKLFSHIQSIKVVCRSFIFNGTAIKGLKAKAVSPTVPYPTSFEAVSGFMWHQIMAATIDKQTAPTILAFSANIRSKTIPPLPKAAVGNAIVGLHVCAEKWDEKLPYYVSEIHATLLTVGEKVKTIESKNSAEAQITETGNTALQGLEKAMRSYVHVSSWSKLGLYDVDFGFGKPTKVIPIGSTNPFLRNCLTLLECNDDGIEVWVFMEENEMQILETDQQFLEFASPS